MVAESDRGYFPSRTAIVQCGWRRRARAAGGDAHLTVADQASGWEYDFYDVTSKPPAAGR
jgi:hypothetical protein